MQKFIYLFICCLLSVSTANADVIRAEIESDLSIAPGETKTIVLESKNGTAIETFWQTLKPEECTSSACIKFEEKESGFGFESFNGQSTHQPVDNKVTLLFTNQAKTPVSIQLTQIERTCTAEICNLIQTTDTKDWKVIRIKELKQIQNSEDSSYATLQGVTTKDKEFDVTLAFWFYEPSMFAGCSKSIKRWIDKPDAEDIPYVIAGSTLVSNVENKDRFILSVDTCTKKASNFNAPAESEY